MAGSYPDVPGYRFAYDVDGTVVAFYSNTGDTFNLSSSEVRVLNDDDIVTEALSSGSITGSGRTRLLVFFFPEPRSITGVLANLLTSMPLQWSSDSTDGLDGTWTAVPGFSSYNSTALKTNLRTQIFSVSLDNVTAIRLGNAANNYSQIFRNFHIYGTISPANGADRLRVVDVSNNDIAAQLDFGNLKQRATSTKQFKIINNSLSQTANNITVNLEAATDATPSLIGQYQISTDNIAFANAVNIGTLAPGAESGTLYVRMNPANNAMLSVWSARIIAHPTSWS
jgi:hypothetical protein